MSKITIIPQKTPKVTENNGHYVITDIPPLVIIPREGDKNGRNPSSESSD